MLGACFDPKLAFENGALTCTQDCPPGYDCIQGHCYRHGTGPEDAPPVVVDAAVDVPQVPDAACSAEGAQRCVAAPSPTREVCRSGEWVADADCLDPTPFCIDQGMCGPCSVGQLRCTGSTVIEACVISGSTTVWQTQETCDQHNFCDAFQGTETQPTCCREPCWVMVAPDTWVRNGCSSQANTCGASQVCGSCGGSQNFCCRMDPPFRCTTVQQCNL
jgi:hypothetical protein